MVQGCFVWATSRSCNYRCTCSRSTQFLSRWRAAALGVRSVKTKLCCVLKGTAKCWDASLSWRVRTSAFLKGVSTSLMSLSFAAAVKDARPLSSPARSVSGKWCWLGGWRTVAVGNSLDLSSVITQWYWITDISCHGFGPQAVRNPVCGKVYELRGLKSACWLQMEGWR